MIEFAAPFAENRQPRCPCVLVLDCSGSMKGKPIEELNHALAGMPEQIRDDSLALKRVEVALVTFPPVRTAWPFSTMDHFSPPKLTANGGTPLGAAVMHALHLIEARKAEYRDQNLDYFRPLLFVLTDGKPNPDDNWQTAAAATKRAEEEQKLAFFGVGTPEADFDVLSQFSGRLPAKLRELRFREMIQWLSRSMKAVSRSASHTGGAPAAKVALPGVADWAEL